MPQPQRLIESFVVDVDEGEKEPLQSSDQCIASRLLEDLKLILQGSKPTLSCIEQAYLRYLPRDHVDPDCCDDAFTSKAFRGLLPRVPEMVVNEVWPKCQVVLNGLEKEVHLALQHANPHFAKNGTFARPVNHPLQLSRSDRRSTGQGIFFECYLSICIGGHLEEGKVFTIIGRTVPHSPRSRTLPIFSKASTGVPGTAPSPSDSLDSRATAFISYGPSVTSTTRESASISSDPSGRNRRPDLPRSYTAPTGQTALPQTLSLCRPVEAACLFQPQRLRFRILKEPLPSSASDSWAALQIPPVVLALCEEGQASSCTERGRG